MSVAQQPNYIVNVDSPPFPEIVFPPTDEPILASAILSTMGQDPKDRYYGAQWRFKPTQPFTIRFSHKGASLITEDPSKNTVAWNVKAAAVGNFVKLTASLHSLNEKQLYSRESEILVVNNEIMALLPAAKSAMSERIFPYSVLSSKRFFFFNTEWYMPPIAGKNILVSGCGTGTEVAALMELGAASATGVDANVGALAVAQARFRSLDRVSFKASLDQLSTSQPFDMVISRHVLEHIPVSQRPDYLRSLSASLRRGGHLILSVPNFYAPTEPHTGLDFFHLLPQKTRESLVRNLAIRAQNGTYPLERVNMLRELVSHDNIRLDDLLMMIPVDLHVVHNIKTYNSRGQFDDEHYDEITLVIEKRF